jgi:hypothetical protein
LMGVDDEDVFQAELHSFGIGMTQMLVRRLDLINNLIQNTDVSNI